MKGLGAFGESWAAAHLSRLGYQILERNVRYRTGELDIVARDGPELVFVEVKCRRSTAFGSPEQSIDRARFDRLQRAIDEYLTRNAPETESYRLDVVAIELDSRGRVQRGEVLKGVERP